MKSRLAVSLLFILIASTFASDATSAFNKLRSWTGKARGRCGVQVCNRPHLSRKACLDGPRVERQSAKGYEQLVNEQVQ